MYMSISYFSISPLFLCAVRFYTAMSGHHTIRMFSYVVLIFPFFLGACCCLVPASMHWNSQWREFSEDVKDRSFPLPPLPPLFFFILILRLLCRH